jgi:tRNA nucleotidyltransferase (CCA-adding enzyme)
MHDFDHALPTDYRGYLETIRQLAAEQAHPLYFVGGFVRDWLLGRPSLDFDLVVVGPAIPLAEAVQLALGGYLHTHGRFGTAKWWPTPDHQPLDFITARTESYAHPGTLPDVRPSHIQHDLARRDFTINAIAVRVDGDQWGELVDEQGGVADLQAKMVRVLHPQSFVDDATRMWRAVRYEQRLGFALEAHTAAWLQRDLPYLSHISGDRIRHELEYILHEPQRAKMFARLDELGLLAQLHPACHWSAEAEAIYGRTPPTETIAHWFALWLATQPAEVRTTLVERLRVTHQTAALVHGLAFVAETAALWTAATPPSAIVAQLRPHAPHQAIWEVAHALFPASHPAHAHLLAYAQQWRTVRPHTTGHVLRQRGLPPGPLYQHVLDQLLAAKLDGRAPTAEAELALLDDMAPQK